MTDHTERSHETGETTRNRPAGTTRATRRSVVKAIGAGAVAAGTGASVLGTGSAVGISTPALHTEGRWIRDPSGNDVRLRGFATASLDFIARSWYPKSVEEILNRGTNANGSGWKPTVVRLPVTRGGVQDYGGIDSFVSEVLRPAVDLLADRGVYAMIDYHLIRPYTQAATEDANSSNDAGYDPIDDVMTWFWETVAPEFAEDEHVLYELFNEPTHPVTWGDLGEAVDSQETEWQRWRSVAQPWVDLVKSEAPDRPLVIGSPGWTSRTNFAPEYPFEGEDLIYASHIYPDNGTPSEFDSVYGAPAEEVPVFLTEFGWDPDSASDSVDHGTTSDWGQPVREWVEGYENMSWTAWCFDDTWAPTFFSSPGDGVNGSWTLKDGPEQHGGFVKQWLADTHGQQAPGGDSQTPTPTPDPSTPTDTPTPTIVGPDPNGTAPIGRDLDGDGLYEDVNDNGESDFGDVTSLFDEMDSPGVADNPERYDFNDNGELDFGDVVALFEQQ